MAQIWFLSQELQYASGVAIKKKKKKKGMIKVTIATTEIPKYDKRLL